MSYLITNRPRRSQFSSRGSSRCTGLIVLHTAESILDTIGPDSGAENVAKFIQNRREPGSYHDLVDSDSWLNLVPYDLAAYQDGTGSNRFGLSISFALAAKDWSRLSPEKRDGFLYFGAMAFANQQRWLKDHNCPTTPLRRLSKAQSDSGMAGFITHGDRDPGRRSDPGADFPWGRWYELCAEITNRPPPPPPVPLAPGLLVVDGDFGPKTVVRLQDSLNRTGAHPRLSLDGAFGPMSKKALQARLNHTNGPVTIDGDVGPQTTRALQRNIGVRVDGDWGPATTSGLQRTLNIREL